MLDAQCAIDVSRGYAHSAQMRNDLEVRTKRFALEVISFVASLKRSKGADVITHQLLKSATSIGANYREAARAQSRDDFIYKLAICEKEAGETEYWLQLLAESRLGDATYCETLLRECRELIAILVTSSRTAKARR